MNISELKSCVAGKLELQYSVFERLSGYSIHFLSELITDITIQAICIWSHINTLSCMTARMII